MANEFRVKNGLIVDEVSSGAGVLTIADSNISSDDGSIEITVIDGQTVTLGQATAGANIVVAPHGTAANEKITATNNAGTADDAILLDAEAGGITLRADGSGKRVHFHTGILDTTQQATNMMIIDSNTSAFKISDSSNNAFITVDTSNNDVQFGNNIDLIIHDGGILAPVSQQAKGVHFQSTGGISVGSSTFTGGGTGFQVNAINTDLDYVEARLYVGVAEAAIADTLHDEDLGFLVIQNASYTGGSAGGSMGMVVTGGATGGAGYTWGWGTARDNTNTFVLGHMPGKPFDDIRGSNDSPFEITTASDSGELMMITSTGTHTTQLGAFVASVATAGDHIWQNGSLAAPHDLMRLDAPSGAGAATLKLYEGAASSNNYVGLKAGTMGSDVTFTLPTADGSSGQVLQTNGSGVLSFTNAASGGAGQLNELSDVSYSSGDLTITSLDTIISGAIVHDSSGKITLDSDTGDIAFADGGTEQLAIDMDGTAGEIIVQLKVDSDDLVFKQFDGTEVLRLDDDGDVKVNDDLRLTSDSSVFAMGAGNDVTITHDGTTGATIAGNPLTLDSGGDITLDADGADVILKDAGTQYGALSNSSGNLVIKSGTTTAISMSGADVTIAGNLTISGTTTAVNTTTMTVEDAIIELGLVDGSAPSSETSIDFGMVINHHDGSAARKSAFFYDDTLDHWALSDIVTESGQVLTPAANATGLRFYYDPNNHFTIGVGANGVTTMTTVDSDGNAGNLTITADGVLELDSTGSNDIVLDSAQDIELNVAGNDINLKSGSDGFGSLTNSSGDLQIKAASGKGIELRSNTDLEFVIEDDAGTDQSTFLFHTESTAGSDLTGVDNEAAPVTMVYKSASTELGRTEFGKVQQAGTGTTNQIFQFASGTFSVAEVTLHATDGVTQQANKMIICADPTGTDEVAFSNYSEVYSDGSTKLVDYAVAISSDTVTLSFDGDDDDTVTYAVTFLA